MRLETNMTVPPVGKNIHVRTLRNRNIPNVIRHRQIDNHTDRGQIPNIPPQLNSL